MLEKYIRAARGEVKASVVLKNSTYIDVFNGKLRHGDIAVTDGRIVGVGGNYSGERELDCSRLTILPGYIDSHVHIESSQLTPEEFASLVVPRGTTAVIADPHEITNVCGFDGCRYILRAARKVPLDVMLQLPSCVPATPFETNGAVLTAADTEKYILSPTVNGLGEFMNYTGVIRCDGEALKKLEAAHASGKIIDGHAPSLTGAELNAYLCGGISTDHECLGIREAEEKVSKGMYVQIRHGSSARNLSNAECITPYNYRRFLLCTDDRHAEDLLTKGHIDDALRRLVGEYNIDPVIAVACATLNAAECYNLKWRGAVAPFYFADLVAVEDLRDFKAAFVMKNGEIVAKDGKALFSHSKRYLPEKVLNTVRLKRPLCAEDFILKLKGSAAKTISVEKGGLVTHAEICNIPSVGGDVAIKGSDILKLAVVERHKLTGNIALGLLKGYGFHGGAMGLSIAHDSHNIILIGDDNFALSQAANTLSRVGGGMVIVKSGGEIDVLPLDIGGLMSSESAPEFVKKSAALASLAYSMGVKEGYEPFMSLAFLSLGVIPELKLLDRGLFDVSAFEFTDIDA